METNLMEAKLNELIKGHNAVYEVIRVMGQRIDKLAFSNELLAKMNEALAKKIGMSDKELSSLCAKIALEIIEPTTPKNV